MCSNEEREIKIKVTETGQSLDVVVFSKRPDCIEVILGEGVHNMKCALTPTRNGMAYVGSIKGREWRTSAAATRWRPTSSGSTRTCVARAGATRVGPVQAAGRAGEDQEEDEDLAGKPTQAALACRILWVALVIGLLSMHPAIRGEWWGEVEDSEAMQVVLYGTVALLGAFVVAYGILIYLIGRRNDVARWLLLVMLALGWIVTLGDFAERWRTLLGRRG